MLEDLASEYVRPLSAEESFQFRCHSGVACFNECCRELELALTPYDVLRLKGALGLTSEQFLEQYALIEQAEEEPWPRVYLGMVDDGRGSCPFVSPAGCRVYEDRPGACRMYPLGRGARRTPTGRDEIYVLLTEPHCLGFAEARTQTIGQWLGDQKLMTYNAVNDQVAAIFHHERLAELRPGPAEQEKFLLALYRLDEFKNMILAPDFTAPPEVDELDPGKIAANELALLRYAIRWLRFDLFGDRF
ncbi:MAG: YkgJ family cysteine cluster protein [Deltaproteobacteria bacterium]|jgi:Fe-S-cluster containining protein